MVKNQDVEGFENVDTEQTASMLQRAKMYLTRIRAIYRAEKAQSKKILSAGHYDDKPDLEIREEKEDVHHFCFVWIQVDLR